MSRTHKETSHVLYELVKDALDCSQPRPFPTQKKKKNNKNRQMLKVVAESPVFENLR